MSEPRTEQLPDFLDDLDGGETQAEPTGALKTGPLRFARMSGSSIAGRDAAPWVTDFLNAAYYRRAEEEREVDDLRLAFAILTTYWYRDAGGRRLRFTDVAAFHRAFGTGRFDTSESGRGLLNREQLLAGGAKLLGDWFPEAYADDARRGWGIAFPTVEERDAYDPARRLALARLGEPTPEAAPPEQQVWHTYPPVEMPSAEAVIAALEEGMARYGENEPRVVPEGATPLVGFDLTTHRGHFMGAGHNRLVLYTHEGKAWVRAAGTWDPMPWHIGAAYRTAGSDAQHAFWGQGDLDRLSMLHQLAQRIAA